MMSDDDADTDYDYDGMEDSNSEESDPESSSEGEITDEDDGSQSSIFHTFQLSLMRGKLCFCVFLEKKSCLF